MIAFALRFLGGKTLPWLLVAVVAGGGLVWLETVKSRAYDRGYAKAQAEMRATLDRQEAALREALRRNENLTDPELDCRLKRLRNPGAACP